MNQLVSTIPGNEDTANAEQMILKSLRVCPRISRSWVNR